MHSNNYETALRRLDALDALGGFDSVGTLYSILKPTIFDPDLRLIAALAMISVGMLADDQFTQASHIAVAEAIMPIALYEAWDDDADGLEAIEECREMARCLAGLATKASSASSE